MAILIDADVLIEAERGTFDLLAWLESLPDQEFRLAATTVAELWHGVERATGTHRAARQHFLEQVLATFEVADYTERTAVTHARLWMELGRTGTRIGLHDLMMPATALERGDTVATFNKRHFAYVKGLQVIEPA